MSIVSSSYVVGHTQACGRSYVTETHTDHLGVRYTLEYLASPSAAYDTILANHAAQIEVALAEGEVDALLNDGA